MPRFILECAHPEFRVVVFSLLVSRLALFSFCPLVYTCLPLSCFLYAQSCSCCRSHIFLIYYRDKENTRAFVCRKMYCQRNTRAKAKQHEARVEATEEKVTTRCHSVAFANAGRRGERTCFKRASAGLSSTSATIRLRHWTTTPMPSHSRKRAAARAAAAAAAASACRTMNATASRCRQSTRVGQTAVAAAAECSGTAAAAAEDAAETGRIERIATGTMAAAAADSNSHQSSHTQSCCRQCCCCHRGRRQRIATTVRQRARTMRAKMRTSRPTTRREVECRVRLDPAMTTTTSRTERFGTVADVAAAVAESAAAAVAVRQSDRRPRVGAVGRLPTVPTRTKRRKRRTTTIRSDRTAESPSTRTNPKDSSIAVAAVANVAVAATNAAVMIVRMTGHDPVIHGLGRDRDNRHCCCCRGRCLDSGRRRHCDHCGRSRSSPTTVRRRRRNRAAAAAAHSRLQCRRPAHRRSAHCSDR